MRCFVWTPKDILPEGKVSYWRHCLKYLEPTVFDREDLEPGSLVLEDRETSDPSLAPGGAKALWSGDKASKRAWRAHQR